MNRLTKKIFLFLMIFSMVLSSVGFPVFASEPISKPIKYIPKVTYNSNDLSPRNLNAILISSRPDEWGINVRVENIGADPLDNVVVRVTGTEYPNPQEIDYGKVWPLVGQGEFFYMPMVRCNMEYYIRATIQDGTQVKTKYGEAALTFDESDLTEWDKGGKETLVQTVDEHFEKHHDDKYVNVDTLPQYLNAASEFRYQVLTDVDNGNLDNYVIREGSDSMKYTDKTSNLYIKLKKGTDKILTFGGN